MGPGEEGVGGGGLAIWFIFFSVIRLIKSIAVCKSPVYRKIGGGSSGFCGVAGAYPGMR